MKDCERSVSVFSHQLFGVADCLQVAKLWHFNC